MSDKVTRIKAIKSGKGIQYILNEAYKILGNPALVFDMDFTLIASPNGAINDDPIWNEFMEYGRLGSETIDFCKNESFIDSVANSTCHDGVSYLISDKLKYNRIFGQLYNKEHQPVADLCAVECEKNFKDDTPELIKALCDVLSKELSKSEYYNNYGQVYQESIIRELIEGNNELYSAHVANIDKDLKQNIFIAVADITQCNPARTKLVIRDLFRRTQPSFKYAIYAEYIVILIGTDYHTFRSKRDLRKLYELFEQENIYIGVSNRFENLYQLSERYAEACNALNGRSDKDGQLVFVYDENMA